MIPGESSCPEGSEYVWQRGIGSGGILALASCSIFLNRYGILKVVPGESSCPEGSEYVWQKEVRGV